MAQDVAAILKKLDEQYEEYLGLLHEYTAARGRLARLMSDGYFALAQANFTAPSRTRFGQDQYDERMQAMRTVHVEARANEAFSFTMAEPQPLGAQSPPEPPTKDGAGDNVNLESREELDENQLPGMQSHDPIRWFGILVPQALKSCQSSFVAIVAYSATIASLDAKMKALEIEVRRNKKRLNKVQQESE